MTEVTTMYCTLDQQETDTDLKKKDRYVSFRLLLSEAVELDELAKKEKLDRSKFIRSKIFAHKIAA